MLIADVIDPPVERHAFSKMPASKDIDQGVVLESQGVRKVA